MLSSSGIVALNSTREAVLIGTRETTTTISFLPIGFNIRLPLVSLSDTEILLQPLNDVQDFVVRL
jgi:hypothetical protein